MKKPDNKRAKPDNATANKGADKKKIVAAAKPKGGKKNKAADAAAEAKLLAGAAKNAKSGKGAAKLASAEAAAKKEMSTKKGRKAFEKAEAGLQVSDALSGKKVKPAKGDKKPKADKAPGTALASVMALIGLAEVHKAGIAKALKLTGKKATKAADDVMAATVKQLAEWGIPVSDDGSTTVSANANGLEQKVTVTPKSKAKGAAAPDKKSGKKPKADKAAKADKKPAAASAAKKKASKK